MIDRSRGTLIGLAVGDALGAAVEFHSPGSFAPVTGFRGGGPHGLAAGQPPAIQGSGWVVQSLEAALWAFHQADSFEEAVLAAVNLGDDADTTGAVCGQLAGACFGETNIPEPLRNGLARRDLLEHALAGIP